MTLKLAKGDGVNISQYKSILVNTIEYSNLMILLFTFTFQTFCRIWFKIHDSNVHAMIDFHRGLFFVN